MSKQPISLFVIWIIGLHVSCSNIMLFIANLYDSFMNLPNHFLSDDWLAIIVPGFEYKHSISHCKDYQSCIESYLLLEHTILNRYADTVPKTKKELKECLNKKMCQIVREEFQGHVYPIYSSNSFCLEICV